MLVGAVHVSCHTTGCNLIHSLTNTSAAVSAATADASG